MTLLPKRTLEWLLKVKVLLQLFNKSKLRNEPFFLFLVKFKKLGFSVTLRETKSTAYNHIRLTLL